MPFQRRSRRIRPLLLVLAVLLIAALSVFFSNRHASGISTRKAQTPKITNRTTALRVIETSISGSDFPALTISLVNESSRNINAYVLAIGNLSITTDFASIGQIMEPGAIRVEKVPMNNFHSSLQKSPELSIAAVSFQGYSGDGDATELQLLLERHSGINEQVRALLPLLRDAQSNFSSLLLADIERTVLTKNHDLLKARSGPTQEGQEWVIKEFQRKLKAVKNRKDVEDMIVFYEDLLANL